MHCYNLVCNPSAQALPRPRPSYMRRPYISLRSARFTKNTKALTLFSIMNNCIVTRRSASKNKHKKGDAQYPGLCTAVAILLKEHNRVMCGVQSYVSSFLFSTKLHKKVCACVCVCVCHAKEICTKHTNISILIFTDLNTDESHQCYSSVKKKLANTILK